MSRLLVLSAIGAILFLAACGGDDETTSSSTAGTSGASGATGLQNSGSSEGIATAGEFVDASLPDEIAVVKDIAAANPDECSDVDAAGEDFQVGVAVSAASVSADTPIEEVILEECGK